MLFSTVLTFFFGLIVITVGAEILLKGASKIASLLNIRPMVIGLTVVSIGTSLPELAVGMTAIGAGASDMAVGNIAGTNLVNILFILGLSAAIRPLPLHMNSIKQEVYAMILAAVMLLLLSLDGNLGKWEGLVLFCSGIVFLIVVVRSSRNESVDIIEEYVEEYGPSSKTDRSDKKVWAWHIMLLFCGIIATIYGAEKLVESAVTIAQHYQISDAIIGLTIVAIGTSAPELVTTLIATYKDDRDVAIGNLLGSSVVNIFIILGITAFFTPNGITISDQLLWFDLPLAALVALICYPVFRSDQMVSRREGILFVGLYLANIAYLLIVRV